MKSVGRKENKFFSGGGLGGGGVQKRKDRSTQGKSGKKQGHPKKNSQYRKGVGGGERCSVSRQPLLCASVRRLSAGGGGESERLQKRRCTCSSRLFGSGQDG